MKNTNKRKWLELIWVTKLLERYFNDSATEKEKHMVDRWTADNMEVPSTKTYEADETTERIWQHIVTELHLMPQASKKKLFQLNLYAVAASVVLLVSATFMLMQHPDTSEIKAPVDNIVNSESIPAGTDKAILTLEDGTDVVLTDKTHYKTNAVESNGEKIVYNTSAVNDASASIQIKYNYLTVPRGGQYFVKLADGSQVWLNSESKLKFPTAFIAGKTREVELVYGEAYFDISPSRKHAGAAFKVNNQNQSVQVVGTEFNIKAYKEESKIYTTLVEGKVVVESKDHHGKLIPNQKLTLDLLNNNVTINNVDVQSEISWRDGIFSFKGDTLKDIMKIISRWYDVDVQFDNQNLENIRFNGVLAKNQDLTQILETIKNLSIIKSYHLHDKTLILK